MIGQLGVEVGLEESWVTVCLHQAEDLILRPLEGGGVSTQTEAVIGGVRIDLETEELSHLTI